MQTIIFLYCVAFIFLVGLGALAFSFNNRITRKITHAPMRRKGQIKRRKGLTNRAK